MTVFAEHFANSDRHDLLAHGYGWAALINVLYAPKRFCEVARLQADQATQAVASWARLTALVTLYILTICNAHLSHAVHMCLHAAQLSPQRLLNPEVFLVTSVLLTLLNVVTRACQTCITCTVAGNTSSTSTSSKPHQPDPAQSVTSMAG